MSIGILCPQPGDIVISPVIVSVAYDFGANTYDIAASVTGGSGAGNSTGLTGSGFCSSSISTTAIGAASATATPTGGGTTQTVNFTIGSTGGGGGGTPPPIIIESVDPSPPPQGTIPSFAMGVGNTKFKAKGSIKGTGITGVDYRVIELDMTVGANGVVNEIIPFAAAQITGNNWKTPQFQINPKAGCQYAVQARGKTANGNSGQFTMIIDV